MLSALDSARRPMPMLVAEHEGKDACDEEPGADEHAEGDRLEHGSPYHRRVARFHHFHIRPSSSARQRKRRGRIAPLPRRLGVEMGAVCRRSV
jgi:hypothetical protein